MVLLFNAAAAGDGTGGAAGGGAATTQTAAGATAQPAAAATPAGPSAEEIRAKAKAEARAEFLKEQGFADEDAYKASLDARKKEEEAKLSERERGEKARKEAEEAKAKAEARAEKQEAENKALKAAIAHRDLCDKEQVRPADRRLVEVLLNDEKEAKGKDFDQKKFFDDLRKERPSFFGAAQPQQLANTTTQAGAGAALQAGSMLPGAVNGAQMSPQQWDEYKRTHGLS